VYEIVFYEDVHGNCPVDNLIQQLDQKAEKSKDARVQLKQIIFQLDLLKRVGTRSSSEYVKSIHGDIWELRPGNNRILLFTWTGNKIVLLHSFRKKSNKTPAREILRAEREINDWVNRNGH